MQAIKGLLVVAAIIAACVASFNYVEGHESTESKSKATHLEEKVENLQTKYLNLAQARRDLDGRLRQACAALSEHEIDINACKEEEKEEDKEEGSESESQSKSEEQADD